MNVFEELLEMAFKSLILFKTLLHHFISLLPHHSWEVTAKYITSIFQSKLRLVTSSTYS